MFVDRIARVRVPLFPPTPKYLLGYAVAQLFEALRYKPGGYRFDFR
jgi:hypothetical protein